MENNTDICVVCLEPIADGVVSITSSENQTVCEHCIKAMANVLDQVQNRISKYGIEGAAELAKKELN